LEEKVGMLKIENLEISEENAKLVASAIHLENLLSEANKNFE